MRIAAIALAMAACLPAPLIAQQDANEEPEEVVVVGNRHLMALRLDMLDAERLAYEVFNRFNDEKRFEIHCSLQSPTGSRLEKQVCEPEFEIQAKRTHARHYFENTREMLNQFAAVAVIPNENTPPVYVPAEAMIAFQQKAYRDKMRQVTDAHPEFVAALVKYAETRRQYEEAIGTARNDSNE
ncbi:MAG: hypothetical protein ACO1PZ_08390 [Gammaproteobacteria bacterium]